MRAMRSVFLILAAATALAPLSNYNIARERAANCERFRVETDASAAVWGPPISASGGASARGAAWTPIAAIGDSPIYEARGAIPDAVARRVVAEAEARWAATGDRSSRFTMSAGHRECHAADLPRTRRWLSAFTERELPRLDLPEAASAYAVYDALVLRYDGPAAGQPVHADYATVTLNFALNGGFEGGGTRFEALDRTLRAPPGAALAHASARRHAGAPTTNGTRYAMVVFCSDAADVDHGRCGPPAPRFASTRGIELRVSRRA